MRLTYLAVCVVRDALLIAWDAMQMSVRGYLYRRWQHKEIRRLMNNRKDWRC